MVSSLTNRLSLNASLRPFSNTRCFARSSSVHTLTRFLWCPLLRPRLLPLSGESSEGGLSIVGKCYGGVQRLVPGCRHAVERWWRMWTMLSLGVEQGSVRGNLVGITCLSIDMEPATRDIVSLIIWSKSRGFLFISTETGIIYSTVWSISHLECFCTQIKPEKSKKIAKISKKCRLPESNEWSCHNAVYEWHALPLGQSGFHTSLLGEVVNDIIGNDCILATLTRSSDQWYNQLYMQCVCLYGLICSMYCC